MFILLSPLIVFIILIQAAFQNRVKTIKVSTSSRADPQAKANKKEKKRNKKINKLDISGPAAGSFVHVSGMKPDGSGRMEVVNNAHQLDPRLREFLLKKMNIDVSSLSQQDISEAHEVAISNNLYETIDLKKSSRQRPLPPRKPSAPARAQRAGALNPAAQPSTRPAVSTPIKPSPPPVPARERTETRNREIPPPSLPSQRMKGIASLPMATQKLKQARLNLGSERPRKKEAAPQPGNNDLLKDIRNWKTNIKLNEIKTEEEHHPPVAQVSNLVILSLSGQGKEIGYTTLSVVVR